MTGSAYAAGWPWSQFARHCSALDDIKEELRAAMTGRRQTYHGHAPWGGKQWGGMFGGEMFGPPWGGPPPRWKGPKARRGDVRAAILAVLAEQPMNGYQIIQEVAERSGGMWKPSPGSIYPTLQQLEDEGLVEGRDGEGRRLLQLTDEGRRYVEERTDEMAATWQAFERPVEEETGELKPVIGQVMAAVWQIIVSGNRQQQAEAAEVLAETRRKLYGLLAEGDAE
jgi:DNA-binding PadR family transcriptional regulator